MKKNLTKLLKVTGFLSLSILLLWLAFRQINFDALVETLRNARFGWIGLSLLFAFISFFSRARRWMLLIEPLGYKPRFFTTYHALMIGYLSNYALPRLGEVTRCVSLGKKAKIPVDALIGTVIIERVIDLIMLLLITLVLLISWMEKFGTFFQELIMAPLMEKLGGIFGGTLVFWFLLAAILLFIPGLLFVFRHRLKQSGPVKKVISFLKGILDGLKSIYKMERKWEFILHSLLIWFFYIMMTWVVVFALKETAGLGFIDGIFLLVIGGLGMSAPVTGGFGAFHWIVSRGMESVYGFSLEMGGAYAILAHESNSLFTILLGTLSYLLLMTRRNKKA